MTPLVLLLLGYALVWSAAWPVFRIVSEGPAYLLPDNPSLVMLAAMVFAGLGIVGLVVCPVLGATPWWASLAAFFVTGPIAGDLSMRYVSARGNFATILAVGVVGLALLTTSGVVGRKSDNLLVEVTEGEAKERGLPTPQRSDGVKIAIAMLSVAKGNEPSDYARAQRMFRESLREQTWDPSEVERAGTLYASMMISSLEDMTAFARRRASGSAELFQVSERTLSLERALHAIPGAREMMQSHGQMSIAESGTALDSRRIDESGAKVIESAARESQQTLRDRYVELFGKPLVVVE